MKSGRRVIPALAWLVASAVASAAVTTTIISDVGDRDGFNGAYDPDTQSLPIRISTTAFGPDDPGEAAFTDNSGFVEPSPNGVAYDHVYVLPTSSIVSAEFEIVTFDNAASGFPADRAGRILIDGLEVRRGADQDFFFDAVGEQFDGAAGTSSDGGAELFRVALEEDFFPLLLDGAARVVYLGSGSNSDNVHVDYTRLSITTLIPEPALTVS